MEEFEKGQSHEADIETRANGSQVFSEPYSEAAISRLKNLVLTFYAQGERKYYSISVDGEIVVAKNCDGRKFDGYLRFLTPHTRLIEVRMYQGYSPNCNKYQFFQNRSLAGIEQANSVQEQINRALETQRLQLQLEKLSDQVNHLQEELEDKKIEVEELREQVNEEKLKEKNMKNIAQLFSGGAELLGAFGIGPKKQLAGVTEAPVEVTIEPQPEKGNTAEQPIASEGQEIFDQMVAAYGEEGVKNALTWLAAIAANPEIQEKIKVELQNKNTDGQA